MGVLLDMPKTDNQRRLRLMDVSAKAVTQSIYNVDCAEVYCG